MVRAVAKAAARIVCENDKQFENCCGPLDTQFVRRKHNCHAHHGLNIVIGFDDAGAEFRDRDQKIIGQKAMFYHGSAAIRRRVVNFACHAYGRDV